MLKLNEVAERLSCSLSNVYSLVRTGQLTVTPTGAGGKGYRVAEQSLAAFIETQKQPRARQKRSLKTDGKSSQ